MKRIASAAVIAAVSMAGTGAGPAVAGAEPRPSAQATADASWQRVSNAPGRFSVMVPVALSGDKATTDANGIVTHTFVASQPGRAYVVAYADGTASDSPRVEMDAARDALLKGLPATLVSEHSFKSLQPVGEVTATEFTCRSDAKGTECKARVFWYNSRLYMLGVVSRKGSGSALDTDKFLDSFRITS